MKSIKLFTFNSITLFVVFIISIGAVKKPKENQGYAFLVTVSSSDCLNCTGVLNNLKQLGINYSFLVPTEKERKLVQKALRLGANEGSFIVDEKLYNNLNAENLSWAIIAQGKELIKRVPIKELDKIISLYNGLRRSSGNLKEYVLPNGLECSNDVFFDVFENDFFVLDRFTSSFYACSIKEEKTFLIYEITADEIPVIDLYIAKKFDTLGFAGFLKTYNQTKGIQPNCLKITNFNVNENGVFISLELQMPRVVSKDNVRLEPDYFIGEVVNGEFVRIIYVPRPIDNVNFPRLDAGFFIENEQLYTYFTAKQLWETSIIDCHNFLVEYRIGANGQYIGNSNVKICQPNYWAEQSVKNLDRFSFSNGVGYFVHFPWFVIYTNSGEEVLEIPEIAVNYTNVKGFPPEKGIIISSVMQNDKTFFVSYYNQEESAYKEILYNLESKEVIAIKTICNYPDFVFNGNLKYHFSTGYMFGISLDKNVLYRF